GFHRQITSVDFDVYALNAEVEQFGEQTTSGAGSRSSSSRNNGALWRSQRAEPVTSKAAIQARFCNSLSYLPPVAGRVNRLLNSFDSDGTQKYSQISAFGSNSMVPVVVHGLVYT